MLVKGATGSREVVILGCRNNVGEVSMNDVGKVEFDVILLQWCAWRHTIDMAFQYTDTV